MATRAWWQKKSVRQAWDFARVGSLLMLIPLAVVIGLHLWKQAEQRRWVDHPCLTDAGFTPDGKTLIGYGYYDKSPQPHYWTAAWDAQSGDTLWHRNIARSSRDVRVSPRGDYFFGFTDSTRPGEQVEVRSVATGELVWSAPLETSFSAAWLGDGTWVAIPRGGTLRLHDPATGRPARVLSTPLPERKVFAFVRDLPRQKGFAINFRDTSNNLIEPIAQVRRLADNQVVTDTQGSANHIERALPGNRVIQHDLKRDRLMLTDTRTGRRISEISTKTTACDLSAARQTDTRQIELLLARSGFRGQLQSRSFNREALLYTRLRSEVRLERWNLGSAAMRPVWVVREAGKYVGTSGGTRFALVQERLNGPLAIIFDGSTGKPLCRIVTVGSVNRVVAPQEPQVEAHNKP